MIQPEPNRGNSVVISDEELQSLLAVIEKRHGIDFSCYEPKSLKRRVMRTLHVFNLNTVHELWIKILKEHSFIYPFMDQISVGLTSLFRDPVLWRRLRNMLGNDLNGKTELAIWHAGCSTGEELYTMGIVLKESLFRGSTKIRATDISHQAMEIAKKGEYSLLKLKEYRQNYLQYNPIGAVVAFQKYYEEKGSDFCMDTDIIRHVLFEYHNLITSPFLHKYDMIFCRNVMIYFDNKTKQILFDKFYDSLRPDGLFIIGFYDAVLPMINPQKFKLLDLDAKIFQKVGVANNNAEAA